MTDPEGKPPPVQSWTKWIPQRRLEVDEIVLLVLLALSVIGMAITDAAPEVGFLLWLIMVPMFGVTGVVIERLRAPRDGQNWSQLLRSQIFHWVGLLIAIKIIYLLLYMGRLDYENTGFVVALLLALTTYLAGVHLRVWRLCAVGVFLALSVVLAGYIERYAWLVLIFAGLIVAALSFYVKSRADASLARAEKGEDDLDGA